MVENPPAMRETWVQSLGWEEPLEEGMATHSSTLAWRIPMDRGVRWAAVRGTESDTTERLNTQAHTGQQRQLYHTLNSQRGNIQLQWQKTEGLFLPGKLHLKFMGKPCKRQELRGFPDDPAVKNLPANTGDTNQFNLWSGKTAHVVGWLRPVNHNYWVRFLEPAQCNYWAHMEQLPKPVHPRACTLQQKKPSE